ncbi:MAG TPA: AbrB/MazE/SpoVT family DNA-binding domain-containing protein [Candidatus Paceibacterota bacterium]
MSTTIQKWGNSLGVRLPLDLTRKYGLRQGSAVRIVAAKENIMLEPLSAPRLSLKAMVDKISKRNLHQEFDFGKKVGKEVW